MSPATERPTVRRRALLSLGALALAGCTDANPASDRDSPTSSPPNTDTPAGSTATGTPPDAGVPPGDSACPGDDVDSVVCVPETDPESVPIALTTDSRSTSLPATFEFTLSNGTDATLSTNFYNWRLWKRVDGEWFHVAPRLVQEPLMLLDPGESHSWELTAEHELPAGSRTEYVSWKDSGTVAGLGGGEYAFTTDGWFGEYNEGEKQFQFGVLLAFDAPDLTLEPTEFATGTSREGGTVTVRGEGSDSEDARRAEFVLSRVDNADDPRKLIPETAAQDYRMRNTLPYFEDGVERVRFVEENATWPVFGVQEPYTVSYQGEQYRVSADVLETETA